ncbi:MAG: YwmB family TATA-box binding protein, partial [Bacillota bacterium]|nr:YwmB family TATA-box binding protein [Bacillota bacterium]
IDNTHKRKVGGTGMNKIHRVFLFFFISIIFVYINSTVSYASNYFELSTKLLEKTADRILEYGIRYEFSCTENGENTCVEIFHGLYPNSSDVSSMIYKNNDQYSVQFDIDASKGSIEYLKEPEGRIVVNIAESKSIKQLEELRTKIDEITKAKSRGALCYMYIKASLKTKDLSAAKETVKGILRKGGASNIKDITISGGYSITAFTGNGTPMKVGNELVDINCAVCSYSSGNYIIIGMPIISTSY